jgi:hypothetical protein
MRLRFVGTVTRLGPPVERDVVIENTYGEKRIFRIVVGDEYIEDCWAKGEPIEEDPPEMEPRDGEWVACP